MISIDYNELNQICLISTDKVDRTWKEIRLQFNQISDQSKITENTIELPWHSFIANTELLQFIQQYYNLEFVFSEVAKKHLIESLNKKEKLKKLDTAELINEEDLIKIISEKGFDLSKRKPTTEQIRNVRKLSRLSSGATFSVPGAGKTTEAICYYLIHKKQDSKLLVICPKNAFTAWEEQFADCFNIVPIF